MTIQPGERFIALRVFNGSWVCAERGGGYEVVADRPAIGYWEVFRVTWLSDSSIGLQAFNGQFLCAEGGGGFEVVANRNALGPWETFEIASSAGGGSQDIEEMSLQVYRRHYWCAEGGGGFEVVANRNAVGPWEIFSPVPAPSHVFDAAGWGEE
jgi:hypothetical protein